MENYTISVLLFEDGYYECRVVNGRIVSKGKKVNQIPSLIVSDDDNCQFVPVPRLKKRDKLSTQDKNFLSAIKNGCNTSNKLAKKADIHPNASRMRLKRLFEQGYITRQSIAGKNNRGKGFVYFVNESNEAIAS